MATEIRVNDTLAPIGKTISRIAMSGRQAKDKVYLSIHPADRHSVIEQIVLKLPKGAYLLDIEGREAPSIQRTVANKYGIFAGVDVTEKMLRGLASIHPSKIRVHFTKGLQEIEII